MISPLQRTEDFAAWARMKLAVSLLSAARRVLFDEERNEIDEKKFRHCVQIASKG